MIIKTRIFQIYTIEYQSLPEMAKAMGISASQVYRVREGKRSINQKFIIGAARAFPGRRLEELFYLAPEPASSSKNHQPVETTRDIKKVSCAILHWQMW